MAYHIWRVKMINIPYEHGEMNIDIVKFSCEQELK